MAARFCSGCGIPIVSHSSLDAKAERRILSVIFCDIVGATALSEAIDPEDMRELLSSYHDTCSQVVQAFGGFLAHLLGDGVVIYFGYPKAHEDDEIRAVRCAMAIQEAVKDLGPRIRHPYEIRIGIHRGRVVVGSLGGASGLESVAIGETPNIAARLQAEASPGSVVVSDSLWRLIANVFAGEYLGNRRLKGVRKPLDIYRILAQQPATREKKLAAHYIGREAELVAIRARWQEALNGQSQAVLIRGEPGIGKSRIIEQFLERIDESDPDILNANCNPFAVDTPYFPLVEMLRHRLAINQFSTEQTLQLLAARLDNLGLTQDEALPLIARFLFQDIDLQASPQLDGLSLARQRKRTHELLIQVLIGLASDGPLLLVVEDLHWADASTIEFLDQLFSSMDGAPILVILTARLEFTSPWKKQANCSEIPLENLVTSQARGIIRNLASGKALPSEVVRQICQRAEGNPLFLEEITLSVLASAGVIERATVWELTQPFSADIVPASLEAALMARLDRLGEARNLLQLGATIGREFRLDLLANVASIDINAAEESMEKMVDQGFLRLSESDPSVYRFKHALIQDVAYQSLLRSTRQQNHARIAAVLAESFPDLAKQRPELMAHHFSGAGSFADAARLWLQAGQEAAGRSAVHEAVEHLNRGLKDLDQLPQEQERWSLEFQLQASLAPTQMAAFGWASPRVESTCLRAIDLADSMAIGEHRFALLWGLWSNQFVAGQLNRALNTAQQLQRIAQTSGITMHAIAAHNAASYTHFYRGEYSPSIQQADQGLALFNRELELELCLTLQSAPTVHILSARSNSLWMLGRQRDAYEGMEQMLELARSLCHPPSLAAALCYLCFFNYYDQNWDQMLIAAEEALELSMAEGYALWHACAALYKSMAHLALDSRNADPSTVIESAQLFRTTASLVTDPSTSTMIMAALLQSGCLDDALAESEQGVCSAEQGHVRVMVSEIHRQRGELLAARGQHQEAEQAFQRALESARMQAAIPLELRALTSLLNHRTRSGAQPDMDVELRQVLNKIQPTARSFDVPAAHSLLASLDRP